MPSQSTDELTLDQAVQSFKQWAQGGDGMDELDFKEYLINYTDEKVREARLDEIELTKANSEESYLGADWFADESITDHSAHEVPLSYFKRRIAQLRESEESNGEVS